MRGQTGDHYDNAFEKLSRTTGDCPAGSEITSSTAQRKKVQFVNTWPSK
jgi:hypothetical protein